jgi:hypothetical protein
MSFWNHSRADYNIIRKRKKKKIPRMHYHKQ